MWALGKDDGYRMTTAQAIGEAVRVDYAFREARRAPCFNCEQRRGFQVECPRFKEYIQRPGSVGGN